MSLRVNIASLLVLLAACLASGCGSDATYEFDVLDLAPPQEELSEFDLGKYSIPIPLLEERPAKELVHRTRFQLDFQLHALIRPVHKSHLAADWARREGQIRDRVIRVCRNASIDELQDPELSRLKARLIDALASQIGDHDVRQLLITDVVSLRL